MSAASSAALVWALTRDLALDGFRTPAAALAADYSAACKASFPLACEIDTGAVPRSPEGRLDVDALSAHAHTWCSQHDDVSCLVEAMLTVRDPFVGYRSDTSEPDQRAARTVFAAQCHAGFARACTELGMTYLEETWSYPSEVWAREAFRRACEAGEPEGCRQHAFLAEERPETRAELKHAEELGHVQATVDLAKLNDDPEAGNAACAKGSAAGCLFTDQPAAACALGDVDACLTERLVEALRDKEDRTALIDMLNSQCSRLDRACREAEFLRDGSPIIPSEPGFYASPGIVERYIVDRKDDLHLCHIRALKVDPESNGLFDVWMRIGADGQVVGVQIPNPFDPGLATCAERVLMTMKLKPPLMGPALSHVVLPFRATTLFDVREETKEPETGSMQLVTRELQARGDAVDRCILKHEDPRYIREGAFTATIVRAGTLQNLTWTSADFEPEAKACIEGVLNEPFRTAPILPTPFSAKMAFVQEYQIPTTKILREPIPPLVPDHFRLLALIPAEATIEGVTTAAPADAADRVTKLHARLAELVADWTKGGLVVETEVRTIPATIPGATLDTEDEELTRLRFEAFDVPDAVWSTLPVGKYDGIVLWLPTPAGRYAAIGTTNNTTLRGASFSALPLTSDKATTRVETLLHGLWAQYGVRAEGQLGIGLPDPGQRLDSEGQTWDPEFWTLDPYRAATASGLRVGDQTGDAMPFYRYLFQKYLHPAMRADLAALDRDDAPSADDLALLSLPLREGGARNLEVLTDGRRSLRPPEGKAAIKDASWLAADRPDDDAGWWGVSWASPVQVRRVRARFAEDAVSAPTVTNVSLEGRNANGDWIQLYTVKPTKADVTVTLPQTMAFDAVRWRVLGRVPDVNPLCTELEVYENAR